MNQYRSSSFTILKYIGILLLSGYLLLVVTYLGKHRDQNRSFTELIADAFMASLYAGIIYLSIFISNITGGIPTPYPRL